MPRTHFVSLKMVLSLFAWLVALPLAAQTNGSTVAPFTTLFEWNRADLTQFTKTDVGTWGNSLNETVRTTQPDSNYTMMPWVEWTTGGGTGPRYRYVLTNSAYQATATEDLVIEADVAYASGLTEKIGLGCFSADNPTGTYYLLTKNGSNQFQLNKYVNGTLYAQTGAIATNSSVDLRKQKARVRLVLTNAGGVRVYVFGVSIIDLPMTLGQPTVFNSGCKPGVVIDVPNGPLSFSRFQVYRMKPDGEQLF